MIQPIEIPTEIAAGDKSSPARQIPAVALCCDAWEAAFLAVRAKGKDEYWARRAAEQAYRDAMPPLSGYQSICDFITCAAYGIVMGAIDDANGSKLLYAAQIALSTLRTQPKLPPAPAPHKARAHRAKP
jgi:hypothetical protein